MAPALDFSKVISGQNDTYPGSQEDSKDGAKSQVAGHLRFRAATNPKCKPILEFTSPVPCPNLQLKSAQDKALQGTELMSRLGLKTISFKTKKKKNLVVLPNIKLLPTAVPNTFRVYKKRKAAETPKDHRTGLSGITHQAFHMAIMNVQHP